MNDPGADGMIEDAEKQNEGIDKWEEEWEEEDTLLKPSRWWFASTACPLIAGTFGPVANAFNICALVQYWREYIPLGKMEGHGNTVPDPAWLTGLNAIAVVSALAANLALMLNMVGRLKFAIAQPMTIVGYLFSSLILIGLVIAANTEDFRLNIMAKGSQRALLPSYYFACFAAALYFMMASLMCLTVWGALSGRYAKKFDITTSQRTLMMQTIALMVYLLVGAGIYTGLENWRYNDSVYWATFTLLTIGIGDNFVPKTHAGRTLLLFYTFGGIVAIGLVISSIRSLLLEKGAIKLHARTVEKKRSRVYTIKDAEWGRGHWWSRFIGKKPHEADPEYSNERERRQAEFSAMREIQTRTASTNRYRALAISSLNAAILWFIGALVFWFSEQHLQHWTYFDSLYFSWVTLITLGYGDFQPLSNAGKAFFVLWALLAIPTLTVLISDMSDTVVAWVSEATNWLGSLTVAPGDTTYYNNLRKGLNKFSGGKLYSSYSETVRREMQREEDQDGRRGNLEEILQHRLSKDEKLAIEIHHRESKDNLRARDTALFHYILVKEVQAVLADTQAQPPKCYTYDEWAYYLKLLGHDEDDPSYHADKYNTPKMKDDEKGPQVGRILDHDNKPRDWAWLSLRSPLLSLDSEADWILKRLLNKLHGELVFKGKPGRSVGDHGPPFSVSAIMGLAPGVDAHNPAGLDGARQKELESTFGPEVAADAYPINVLRDDKKGQ